MSMTYLTCQKCGRGDLVDSVDTSKHGSLCSCCISEQIIKQPDTAESILEFAEYARIDRRFAYSVKDGAIFNSEQMIPGKELGCSKPDAEWQENINKEWWGSANSKAWDAGNNETQIIRKLLSFGGHEVCMAYKEEDAQDILYRGQFWYGDHVTMMKGRQSQCHENACNYWERNHEKREIAIATGYALSENGGMWRQHSWLVLRNARSTRIIETTERRIAYFGFVMTENEALEFCDNNY